MRKIGADMSNNHTISAFWSNANSIVSPTRPGDFNQAVMELGATICSPKGPKCSECPVKKLCAVGVISNLQYCDDHCRTCNSTSLTSFFSNFHSRNFSWMFLNPNIFFQFELF